jgi:hypothetical protein
MKEKANILVPLLLFLATVKNYSLEEYVMHFQIPELCNELMKLTVDQKLKTIEAILLNKYPPAITLTMITALFIKPNTHTKK